MGSKIVVEVKDVKFMMHYVLWFVSFLNELIFTC